MTIRNLFNYDVLTWFEGLSENYTAELRHGLLLLHKRGKLTDMTLNQLQTDGAKLHKLLMTRPKSDDGWDW